MKSFQEWLRERDQQFDEIGAAVLPMLLAAQSGAAPAQTSSMDRYNALHAYWAAYKAERPYHDEMKALIKAGKLDDPKVKEYLRLNPHLDPKTKGEVSADRARLADLAQQRSYLRSQMSDAIRSKGAPTAEVPEADPAKPVSLGDADSPKSLKLQMRDAIRGPAGRTTPR